MNENQKSEVMRYLDRILNSDSFQKAERLRRFLQYLTEHSLIKDTRSLKQMSIAMDVFERDADFDPAIDAIVRVEAGRLRSKLREYYDAEGALDEVQLSLPKRGYTVRFEFASASENDRESDKNSPVEFQQQTHRSGAQSLQNPVIAVLPFDNMSSDEEQEYFSDGLTEDLITDLSRLPGVQVIARQSTFALKGKPTNAIETANKLNANLIVEGSVRKFGRTLRINAQLIDGQSGNHIWADRFDCETENIFSLQDTVTNKILEALRRELSLSITVRKHRRGTDNFQAYDYLLRGLKEDELLSAESSITAEYCYRSAIELDPQYAAAYSRLGLNLVYRWISGWNNDQDQTIAAGLECARRGVEIDPHNAFSQSTLSWALLWNGKHDGALEAGRKAVELDSNEVLALERLALALAWSNHPHEALQLLRKAQVLNPLSGYHFPVGVSHFMAERYKEAAQSFNSSIAANPRFLPSYLYLLASYSLLEKDSEAAKVVEKIKELDPDYKPKQDRHPLFKHSSHLDRFIEAIIRVY